MLHGQLVTGGTGVNGLTMKLPQMEVVSTLFELMQ